MDNLPDGWMWVDFGNGIRRERKIDYIDTSAVPSKPVPELYEGEELRWVVGSLVPLIIAAPKQTAPLYVCKVCHDHGAVDDGYGTIPCWNCEKGREFDV